MNSETLFLNVLLQSKKSGPDGCASCPDLVILYYPSNWNPTSDVNVLKCINLGMCVVHIFMEFALCMRFVDMFNKLQDFLVVLRAPE